MAADYIACSRDVWSYLKDSDDSHITNLQLQDQEEQINAGIAPYSASYQRYLIKTVLEDGDGPQKLVDTSVLLTYIFEKN